MRLSYRLQADGRVLVLDFTAPERPDDADEVRAVITSHRQTTSSRRPGRLIEGSVHRAATPTRRLEICPKCGSSRWASEGPHAVRWNRDFTAQVDCVGQPVGPDAALR